MTFIDVMKQNEVGSGGTLPRECMGRVVFHHEKLDTILKIPGECSMISYEPKRILLRIFKSLCGRFLTSAHLKIKNNIGKNNLYQN